MNEISEITPEEVGEKAKEAALAVEVSRATQIDSLNRESESRIISAVISHFEQPAYSTRELDTRFRGIENTQEQILKQTTKTNGSVIDLKLWRSYLTGGFAVLTLLILPTLGWILLNISDLATKVSAVQAELKILLK